jgi:alanine racemase
MVRTGILLYGFWPSRETLIDYLTRTKEHTDPLTSIISWKTRVMTIKEVEIGEYIGYGTSFLTNRKTRIAIVPVGYGYGYSRALSNQGRVLVAGQRVAVIGMVNMNMMAIDITEVEGVENGSEVVLIGFQGENRITVASFGELSSQLNYELLARLPHNIPRLIKE